MELQLREVIANAYREHSYLQDKQWRNLWRSHLSFAEKQEFKKILARDPSARYASALQNLTFLLHRHHEKRVIVLIDEYDKPVNEAHENGYYDSAIPFLTRTFTLALKDNPYVRKFL
jgi:hypothetical protein